VIIFISGLFAACTGQNHSEQKLIPEIGPFDPGTLLVTETPDSGLTGQVLYMPVYSNIPYHIVGVSEFDMSALVAVHNTDLFSQIRITKALYFDTKGKPVYDFLKDGEVMLKPLETRDFYIPYEDKSGTGANFLIEWVSEVHVTEPLVESVTISLKPNQSVTFLSRGRVIRERR
jgi:hypothetical protein